jgi:hypothetical protein
MSVDAEKVRPAVEYVTRVANDFSFANMFFVKNCSLLLRGTDNPRPFGTQSILYSAGPIVSSHSHSVMSFEADELVHFRGRDPVSAYPLIRLTRKFGYTCGRFFRNRRENALIFGKTYQETLPEGSESLDLLLESLAWLVFDLSGFYYRQVSGLRLTVFQVTMQVEIYDLTSSVRVRRGVKRAWLIEETLALQTCSGQKQLNIHRTTYKGVRYRPSRSLTKPWTAEVKPPMEKNKVWIDDCNTPEAAAHAYDVLWQREQGSQF